MYEMVKKKTKPKGNGPLYFIVGGCLLVMGLVIGLSIWAGTYLAGFRNFVADFSNSTSYAYQYDCLYAQTEEGKIHIAPNNVYAIYSRIANAGAGRLSPPPETPPEATLTYGDGSYMELWTVKLINPTRDREYGLFIRYVNQEGEAYTYDSDKLEITMLQLESWKN